MKYLRICDAPPDGAEPIPPHTHTLRPIGLGLVNHDVPCYVCFDEPAVHYNGSNASKSSFQPCWTCQERGWQTSQPRTWFMKFLNWALYTR